MKKNIIALALCLVTLSACGQYKTENVFIITLDGLRWQELYTGADEQLIGNKTYVGNAEELRELFWRESPAERREVLMPFFWNTLAKEGQLLGNRELGSLVNCTNNMWFSYPGYNEILAGAFVHEHIALKKAHTRVLMFATYSAHIKV